MSISYGSQQVILRGTMDTESECSMIQLFHISTDVAFPAEPDLLPEVQVVVDQYKHLFVEPSSLPPRRACGHTIPLVVGVSGV